MIKELNRPILEDETHRTLRSPCSIPDTTRLRLVEVNAQDIMFLTPVHLDGIVGRQPAQERNEVAIAVPFDGELKVRQLAETAVGKESLHESLVLEALKLLVMDQEKLNHTCIPNFQSTFILYIKVVRVRTLTSEALFQIISHLNMLPTSDIAEELAIRGAGPSFLFHIYIENK